MDASISLTTTTANASNAQSSRVNLRELKYSNLKMINFKKCKIQNENLWYFISNRMVPDCASGLCRAKLVQSLGGKTAVS